MGILGHSPCRGGRISVALCAVSVSAMGCASSALHRSRSVLVNRNSTGWRALPTDGVVSTYARAINLRATDVPQSQAVPRSEGGPTQGGPFGSQVERCDGAETANVYGVRSPVYLRRGGVVTASVQSGVYIGNGSSQIARDVEDTLKIRGRECLRQSILANMLSESRNAPAQELLESNPSRRIGSPSSPVSTEKSRSFQPLFSNVSVSTRDLLIGTQPVYELRTTAHMAVISGSTPNVNYYRTLFAFRRGRLMVVLTSTGFRRPVPQGEEHRLLTILSSRTQGAVSH